MSIDVDRRARLAQNLSVVEADLQAYSASVDATVRPLLRPATNILSDVRGFFLRSEDPNRNDAQEAFWLDHAEFWLKHAVESIQRVKTQVDAYGGPSSARLIG